MLKIFPCLLLCLLFAACSSDPGGSPFLPADESSDPFQPARTTASELSMDISLTLRQGRGGNSALLAVARDDTTSDSLNLYIDVEVTNVGPEIFFLPAQVDTLSLVIRVRFVDYPHYRDAIRGRLRLAVGQTYTGLEATDVLETEFGADTTLTGRLPLSRIDSFQVADNVAVYGQVLSPGRYLVATRVQRFEGTSPPSAKPAPDLVGYVKSTDLSANRLYVNEATVVITDSTRIESSSGELISLYSLHSGENSLTATAMAWALDDDGYIMANGWEFKRFTLIVSRPLAE
ncbi:MAG: hypothetical protein JXQ83_14265 [Candidatus Glassbacteria bacterium]|nr:hypothetical protein [Candidatus Glassbacteria bacterium]